MADITLTKLQLFEGLWTGLLSGFPTGGEPPAIKVIHNQRVIEGVKVVPDTETSDWLVSIPVPIAAIADGVQTILIANALNDEILGSFVLLAGETFDEDLRAEISLLRAELDLLKRAFRRHCVETA